MTDDTLVKLRVHSQTVIRNSQYKFYEIPSIGYLLMAEDGKTDERKDGRKHWTERRKDNVKPTSPRPRWG